MMRIAKIIGFMLAGFLLLLAGCAVFVYYYDWSGARAQVDSVVSAKLQRKFDINGPLAVTWTHDDSIPGWRGYLPWPHIEMQDVTLANPDGMRAAAGENLVKVDKIAFSVDPAALFEREIKLPALVLEHPQANLVRDATGKNNWTLNIGGGPSLWHLNLHKIVIDDGHVDLQDDVKKLIAHTVIDTMDDGGPEGYGLLWKVDGSFNKAVVKGEGKAGGTQSFQQAVPYPLEAALKVGKTSVNLKGTLTKPADLAALDLRMKLSGASMADLFPLTGITLPDTPSFATEGHLVGRLDNHGGVWEYDHFTGRVGSSDLSGSMRYESAGEHGRPRPLLQGTLVSNLLRFKDLGPVIGADQSRRAQTAGTKVLPDASFKFDRWRAIDADVSFTGRKIIKDESLPLDNLVTHIVLRDGTLSLLPLQFGVADGRLTSNLKLDGNGTNIKAAMDVSARHLKLNKLMPDFKPMKTSFGEINGDAKLDASGNSVASLMGTSNGEVKLLVNKGSISKLLLEESGLNVVNVLLIKLFGDSQVTLNCVAGDFVVTHGLVQTQNFLVDTDDTRIGVGGKVDLAKESLDLTVQPENKKFRLVSLRTPVYVDGTFADPHVDVDRGKLALRAGGAIALGVLTAPAALLPLVDVGPGKDSDCAKALREAVSEPKIAPAHK
ncbi:MAG: AsmA family protein [Burkholderiaceae bacterium]|nr:AsmA family protein [Burkholderiaceae bacterium]